ncbi:MAG: hypothetical protein ABIG69_13375 [Bacteroidota bacterium]
MKALFLPAMATIFAIFTGIVIFYWPDIGFILWMSGFTIMVLFVGFVIGWNKEEFKNETSINI